MAVIAGAITRGTLSVSPHALSANMLRRAGVDEIKRTEFLDEGCEDFSLSYRSSERLGRVVSMNGSSSGNILSSSEGVLLFNGELYNSPALRARLNQPHITEDGGEASRLNDAGLVFQALRKWGLDALTELNGAFSLAYFDRPTRRLLMARDRFGIRALYYSSTGPTVAFGSAAHMFPPAFRKEVNTEYLARGVHYRIFEDGSAATPFIGVYSLPAGHYMEVFWDEEGPRFETHQYYDLYSAVLNAHSVVQQLTDADILALLKERLSAAVSARLPTSGQVALSLSGGLDSGSIAALAVQSGSLSKSNEIMALSFGEASASASEGPLVDEISRHLDLRVHYLWPKFTEKELIDLFWRAFDAQGTPFAGLSVLASHLLYRAASDRGYHILLSGQGGDEILMGYRKYFLFYLRHLVASRRYMGFISNAFGMSKSAFSELPRLRTYLHAGERYMRDFRGRETKERLLWPRPTLGGFSPAGKENLWHRQVQDIIEFSLPTLFRYDNRNASVANVATRLPFLDSDIVELALAMPIHLKLRNGYGKWALRKLMEDKLPRSVVWARYKRGFDVAQDWIRNGLGPAIRGALHDTRLKWRDYVEHPIDIDNYFADSTLSTSSMRFTEATSLLWLGRLD